MRLSGLSEVLAKLSEVISDTECQRECGNGVYICYADIYYIYIK